MVWGIKSHIGFDSLPKKFALHLMTGVASLVFAGLIPLPDHSRRSHA